MKILLITSSGIGNAVMLLPLIRSLARSAKNRISILNFSPFFSKDFIELLGLPVHKITELKKPSIFIYLFQNFRYFDVTYLDLSSSSFKNILLALLLSKKVVAMRKKKCRILPV
jgi:ADP-heptose:LPS heptosyltransferase